MYERSAIVLERFFDNLLGFNQVNNLKKNFNNYCELFEKFKVLQTANAEEIAALKEFQNAENRIEAIQAQEERLYNKNAKLQYNRDLIFQDISQKPEEIEKCSLKLEGDIQKNNDKLVSLREDFVVAVSNYNEQKSILSKCKKNRKKAESDYNAIFDETQINLESIPEEYITIAKEFSISEIQSDIIEALAENGKSEKIPFNNQVITNAAQVGFDIKTKEVESYLEAYKLAQKLINELLDGAVSMELHEKKIRNISVKFNFLEAEKDYIVGFLDYERITVIYGKRMHRTLMIDACEKLEKDIEQVENLYKILLKEIAGKSTKKAYKDLYNKSYLMEIEDKDAKFKKEKNRVNLSTGTIMNSNYWRIEGIKNIYTVFYKNVVEVFGRDLDEFQIPEENIDDEALFELQEVETEGKESVSVEQIVPEETDIHNEKVKEIKEVAPEQLDEVNIEEISLDNPEKIEEESETVLDIFEELNSEEKEIILDEPEKPQIEEIALEIPEQIENDEKEIILDEPEKVQIKEIVSKKEAEQEIAKAKPKKAKKSILKKKENISDIVSELPKKAKKKKTKKAEIIEETKPKAEDLESKIDIALSEIDLLEDEEDNEQVQPNDLKKNLRLAKVIKKRGRKKLKHYTRQIAKAEENIQISEIEPKTEEKTSEDNFDIFGEKYQNIDSKLAELENLEEYKIYKAKAQEDFDDIEEESIFEAMESENEDFDLMELNLDEDIAQTKPKKGFFKNLKKLNSKSKKKLANE